MNSRLGQRTNRKKAGTALNFIINFILNAKGQMFQDPIVRVIGEVFKLHPAHNLFHHCEWKYIWQFQEFPELRQQARRAWQPFASASDPVCHHPYTRSRPSLNDTLSNTLPAFELCFLHSEKHF